MTFIIDRVLVCTVNIHCYQRWVQHIVLLGLKLWPHKISTPIYWRLYLKNSPFCWGRSMTLERGKVTIVRWSLRDSSFGTGTKCPCCLAPNDVFMLVGERTRQSTHPDFVSIKLTSTHTWQMALLLNILYTVHVFIFTPIIHYYEDTLWCSRTASLWPHT